MSSDWYRDIQDFHKEVMLDNFESKPHIPESKFKKLRKTLIKEEVRELLQGIQQNDLTKIADGGADAIVVILGTMVTYGIDLRPIWDEVHRTNMLKKDGPIREDGKRLKPEGWEPPEVERLIKVQQNLGE